MLAREGLHHAVLCAQAVDLLGYLLRLVALAPCGGAHCHGAILCQHLLAQALVAVLGHSVCHLVTHHHGQLVVAAHELHDALIDHDFAAGHAPGVHLVALHQVELPGKVPHFTFQPVGFEIGLGGGGNALAHAGHLLALHLLRAELGRLHETGVRRQARLQHLAVAHKVQLLATGDRH